MYEVNAMFFLDGYSSLVIGQTVLKVGVQKASCIWFWWLIEKIVSAVTDIIKEQNSL